VAAASLIVDHVLKTDSPKAAAQWIERRASMDEVSARLPAVRTAFIAVAPEQALAWLDRLSSREGFPLWEAEVGMSQWAGTDLGAAGDWLNANRNSPAAREYIWAYAVHVAVENPEAARKWASLLPPETPCSAGTGPEMVPASAGKFATLEENIDLVVRVLSLQKSSYDDGQGQVSGIAQPAPVMKYFPWLISESEGAGPRVLLVPRRTAQTVQW
jgi:hypothetical protein